jgi:cation transport regulator ChaC
MLVFAERCSATVTFVVNPHQDLYAGVLTDEHIADVVASAQGVLGICADYLWQTMVHLEELAAPGHRP